MGLLDRFKRPALAGVPVTDDIARRIAEHVNAGRTDEASALAESTDNPRYASLAAFRYIDLAED
jgi:hypothetical protein